jgi:hypothetical protein
MYICLLDIINRVHEKLKSCSVSTIRHRPVNELDYMQYPMYFYHTSRAFTCLNQQHVEECNHLMSDKRTCSGPISILTFYTQWSNINETTLGTLTIAYSTGGEQYKHYILYSSVFIYLFID